MSQQDYTIDMHPCQYSILNELPTTDNGEAVAIQLLYGHGLQYVSIDSKTGYWLAWNGNYWIPPNGGQLQRVAVETAKERHRSATFLDDTAARKKLYHWCEKAEDVYRVKAAIEMLATQRGIVVGKEDLDRHSLLLGCANGVVDLISGLLKPGFSGDLITKSTNIAFDASATCPRWLQFLDEVFSEDKELIEFIQRAVGYSLTGLTDEQCLFLCHGSGANGKTVLLSILRALTGDYSQNIAFATLLDSRRSSQSASPDIASLQGARLVTASEVNEGKRLDEGRIKSLTGSDPITARHLYSGPVTFIPEFKLWLAANHKPVIRGTDEAIWRRVKLIPFLAHFDKEKRDPKLGEKLTGELPGILTWAVLGCLKWQLSGLKESEAVAKATADYRSESDILAVFLEERTVSDPKAETKTSELNQVYRKWCEDNGQQPISSIDFGKKLADHGFERYKDHERGWMYKGVGIMTS